MILLQTDEPFQIRTMPSRAVKTVDNVFLLLFFDEKHVEHFLFALAAIMRRFVFAPAMETNLDTLGAHELRYQLGVT